MRRFVCACVLVTSVVACSGDGAEERAAAKGAWSVDATPVLDIFGTTEDGDALLLRPDGATRLSNGTIVVVDRFADGVRFFDPEGHLVRTVGRTGSGPGEFKSPRLVGQCGTDSVFVSDGHARVTVIDSAGQVVRSYSTPADGSLYGCSRRGTVVGFTNPQNLSRPRSDGSGVHYKAVLWFADAEGKITQPIGELPVGEMRPMGKVTRAALTDERLYLGTADSAFVDVYALDGQSVGSVAVGVPPRPATQHQYERAVDLQVAVFADRDMREFSRKMLLEYPMPEFLPPYSALFTDPDGLLWAVTSVPGDETTNLRAIDADGGIVADLHLPIDMVIYEVGRDYILGTYEDGDGEPHVVMYRVRRGH